MSSAFPNMISNEPPPLDSLEDEDEEIEEEGYANSSGRLKLDILADPSPMSSPQRKLPVVSADSEKLSPSPSDFIPSNSSTPEKKIHNVNGTCSETGSINDESSDSPIPLEPFSNHNHENHVEKNGNSGVVLKSSASTSNSYEESDDFGDFLSSEFGTIDSEKFAPLELPLDSIKLDLSQEHPTEAIDSIEVQVSCPIVREKEVSITNECHNPEDEDFAMAQTMDTLDVAPSAIVESNDLQDLPKDEVELKFPPTKELEDDFGDFSNALPSVQNEITSFSHSAESDDEDDGFGDFAAVASTVQERPPPDGSPSPFERFDNLEDPVVEEFSSKDIVPTNLNCNVHPAKVYDRDNDDFGDFRSSNIKDTTSEPFRTQVLPSGIMPPPLRTTLIGFSESSECEEIPVVPARKSVSDEISSGIFSSLSTSSETTSGNITSRHTLDELDEDFGDFRSSDQHEQTTASMAAKFTRKDSHIESKFDALVSAVFDQPSTVHENNMCSSRLTMIDKDLDGKTNHPWTHVQDFEESHGLKFKWPNSIAHRHLLKSLKVDSSTIVYSGRWGAIEVPKFAAHLGDIPLQPQSSLKPASSSTSPDFQEFQSHKPLTNSVSPDSSQLSHPQTPWKESKLSERASTKIPDVSGTRTEELVFPSTPMFLE